MVKEAVDEALSLFGPSVREVVYYHCEVKFGVKREEVVFRLGELMSCLEEIFSEASKVVERQILDRLSVKLKVDLKGRGLRELAEGLEELLASL